MFLLDTNVVSELRKARAGKANAGVTAWAAGIPAAFLFLSVISLHELEHGVLLKERRDQRQGQILRQWLDRSVATAFGNRFLPVDEQVARRAAALHVPDSAPLRDAFIAATALVHAMTVVTRNSSDFSRFEGVEVHNPWT